MKTADKRGSALLRTRLSPASGGPVWRYGLALVAVALALAISLLAWQAGIRHSELAIFLSAIAVTAWYGGAGPAAVAVVCASVAYAYFFLEPRFSLFVSREWLPLFVLFILFGLLVGWFAAVRRRVEDQLRASEATLRERADLLDLTRDTVFVRDLLDIILYWNRGAEELYGWSAQEAIGRSSHELNQTVFPYPLEQINRELNATGRWSGELIHNKRDGTQVVVASRWSLQRDEHGTPVRILETNNDITERKRAEEALRHAEQLARGQIAALMRSLDVLATTPGPAHLITPLLVTVSKQLRARAVLLWLRRETDDTLELRCAVEGDREIPGDPRHPFLRDPQSWRESRFIEEMLITGAPFVSEDMEHDERIGKQWRAHLTEAGMRRLLAVPVLAGGRVRGFIGVRDSSRGPFRGDEIELAQALAHQVMLAVQMAELSDQGRHTAILEERTRMARDIHDTLAQGFTGVIMQMEAAEEALVEGEPEETAKHIQRARNLARESLGEARRSVRALRPQALEKAGFWDALKSTIQNTTIGTSLRTQFNLEGELRELPPAVEENLLQIGREALTNAFKHAHATSFEIRLAFEPEMVRLELRDDGDGFVVDGANGGFGLIGMRERAEQIGGTLTVESARGAGTTIVAVAPYQHV